MKSRLIACLAETQLRLHVLSRLKITVHIHVYIRYHECVHNSANNEQA